jgi:glycyl-tRNA synthetase (class II)
VTVRHRDSMRQDRVSTDQLQGYLAQQIGSWKSE